MSVVIPDLQYRSDHGVERLQSHDVYLRGKHVTLRPLTEDDWHLLLKWNNDPEVMKYFDHEDFSPTSLSEVQSIYRWVSTHAHCFIIEVEGHSIGECWLQRMNLQRIVDQFLGEDLRRIDIAIGEKDLWGRGYGTEAIRLLVDFSLTHERADAIFGIVSADNERSLRAFRKCGFSRPAPVQEEDGAFVHDLVLRRGNQLRWTDRELRSDSSSSACAQAPWETTSRR